MLPGNKRILLVDDDRINGQMVCGVLRSVGGYEVLLERQPEQALAKARKFHPDLVVLDVEESRTNSAEVACQLKSDTKLGPIPILFLSSLGGVFARAWSQRRRRLSNIQPEDILRRVAAALV